MTVYLSAGFEIPLQAPEKIKKCKKSSIRTLFAHHDRHHRALFFSLRQPCTPTQAFQQIATRASSFPCFVKTKELGCANPRRIKMNAQLTLERCITDLAPISTRAPMHCVYALVLLAFAAPNSDSTRSCPGENRTTRILSHRVAKQDESASSDTVNLCKDLHR